MNRIRALASRDWTENASLCADQLTAILRQPTGTMRLREIQAVALLELYRAGGAFLHIRTGGGKTLITGLAPTVLGAKRPLLIMPAKLIAKTCEEFAEYRKHFLIPHNIKIISYETLGREEHADFLERYQPDWIGADEAHKLKNVKTAACAIRVVRYMVQHPNTVFCSLSGSLAKGSILDYAHLLVLGLKSGAPVPIDQYALEEWAACLDADSDETNFAPLIPALGEINSLSEARQKFQTRLASTPGVIISRDSFNDVPLQIAVHSFAPSPGIAPHLANLYKYFVAPDGWEFADSRFEVYSKAREMALDFCYVYDPRPPDDWFAARRGYCYIVRKVIEDGTLRNEKGLPCDTELQVRKACEARALPKYALDAYDTWTSIKDTFKPNSLALWYDYAVAKRCIDWAQRHPAGSLIWVEHTAFGELLETVTGWSYYRNGGKSRQGVYIENADPRVPAIISVDSNLEGRNLQYFERWGRGFDRNLVPAGFENNPMSEQLISRTHRDGQRFPVTVELFEIVKENASSLDKALDQARFTQEHLGQEQKLLIAEWVSPQKIVETEKRKP